MTKKIEYFLEMLQEGKLIYENGKILRAYNGSNRGKWLEKPKEFAFLSTDGYRRISVYVEGKAYKAPEHRVIYCYFNELKEMPKGMQINHKDGNKLNNNIENLELVTAKENICHAIRTGLKDPKNNKGNQKYSDEEIERVRELLKDKNLTQKEISDITGISTKQIRNIKTGKSRGRTHVSSI